MEQARYRISLIHFLDVGRGDSIILQFENGRTYLVDSNEVAGKTTPLEYLTQVLRVKELETVVVTHPHRDHIRGVQRIIEHIPTRQVWLSGYPWESQIHKNLTIALEQRQDIRVFFPRSGTFIAEGGGTYWVEHDTDGGFQFKKSIPLDVLPPEGDEETFVKLNDGHFTTGDWNKTGWIWVKWKLDGPHLLAKYWSTASSEPSEWTIEGTDDTYAKGFAGLGVWSGHAHIAYIRISDLAGATAVDKADKLSTTWSSIKTK